MDKTEAYKCVGKMHSEPLSKRDVTNLLYGYKAARASIGFLRSQLQEDADLLLYPPGQPIDKEKVTCTPDPTAQEMAMLARSSEARSYYKSTLEILDESTRILDKLMLCVAGLLPEQRFVVLETMINRKTVETVAEDMGVSTRTVNTYKSQAIDRVFDLINSVH